VTIFVAPQDVRLDFKFGLQNCFDFDMPRVACNIDGDINKFRHFEEVFFENWLMSLKCGARGGVVVKALRYKPAGRGVDSRWCQ